MLSLLQKAKDRVFICLWTQLNVIEFEKFNFTLCSGQGETLRHEISVDSYLLPDESVLSVRGWYLDVCLVKWDRVR